MDLRQYLFVLQRGLGIIIGITLTFTLVVSAFIYFGAQEFDAVTSVTVDRQNSIAQKDANYYLYDNYYGQQSSGLLADTIINWMASPSVVKSIYTRAGVSLPEVRKISKLGKIFIVRKMPPATVNISVSSDNETRSQLLIQSAVTELKARSLELNKEGNSNRIELHATNVVSAVVKPFWALNLSITILTGLLLGLFVVLIRDILYQPKRS